MKHVRKALALMLATFVALVIAAPAFAQDISAGGTGNDINKIVVDNAEIGSEYSLIQVFKGTADAANQQQPNPYKPMTYVLTDAQKQLLAKDGAQGTTQDEQDLIDYFKNYFEMVNDYNVKIKDEAAFKTYIDSAAGNAEFAEWAAEFGTTVAGPEAASSVPVTFTNVPYGYYIVTTDTGIDAQHPTNIVTIDSSTPVETHVIDKNVVTDIKKTIEAQTINGATIDSTKHSNSAELEEEITFLITGDAKNFEGTKKMTTYFVEDSMDKEFEITEAPVVKVGGNTLTENTDYTIISGGAVGDNGFVIRIPWTSDGTMNGSHIYKATDKIEITYKAKLAAAKVPANYKPSNKNIAKLKPVGDNTTVVDQPPTGTDFPEDETTTYNTGITITKTDDSTPAKPLPGAVFTLTPANGGDLTAAVIENASSQPTYDPWDDNNSQGDKWFKSQAAASGYTKDDPATEKPGINWTDANTWPSYNTGSTPVVDPLQPTGAEVAAAKIHQDNYVYTLADYDEWDPATMTSPAMIPAYEQKTSSSSSTTVVAKGTATSNAITATTDADGKATFAALGPGTYKIVETTVPNGYMKVADHEYLVTYDSTTHQFTWKQTAPTAATQGTLIDVDGLMTDTLIDPVGTEFPETGGMGTRILYTVGGLMVAGAAIYLITKKRMASEA